MRAHLIPAIVVMLMPFRAWSDVVPAPPPAPSPPSPPVNLNSRTFLATSSVFDPIYGLGKIGIVKNGTVEFVATKKSYTPPEADKVIPKGFKTYDYTFNKADGGEISIPVVGSFSINKEEMLHIIMEDISEVQLQERRVPGACEIWSQIETTLISEETTIIFTDHAVFSTLQWGAGTKAVAGGEIGIGSYFSASGSTYKDAASMLKVPVISVDGIKFTVKDPQNFCKNHEFDKPIISRFNTIEDLGLAKGATIQFKF